MRGIDTGFDFREKENTVLKKALFDVFPEILPFEFQNMANLRRNGAQAVFLVPRNLALFLAVFYNSLGIW